MIGTSLRLVFHHLPRERALRYRSGSLLDQTPAFLHAHGQWKIQTVQLWFLRCFNRSTYNTIDNAFCVQSVVQNYLTKPKM